MTLAELDKTLRSLFSFELCARSDSALNGLQVGDPDRPVKRIAFAVDACLETIERAAALKADVLLVHHGLFWGRQFPLTGLAYKRLETLCEAKMALYAMHLPLDMHPELGNNAGLAKALDLKNLEAFGEYHGVKIGFKGVLPLAMTIEEIMCRLFGEPRACSAHFPFGKKMISTVGIVSGGAADLVEQAVEEGLDAYITGEPDHTKYHYCLEAGINVIFGGHYQTETWGVSLLSNYCKQKLDLETVFIEVPTGL